MIPRIDKLNPPDDRRIPTRQVTLEKLVDGELESTIADAIPPSSLLAHDLLGHQNAYDLTIVSGVNVVVGAGRARIDHTTYIHGATGIALNVNADNYIKINAVGALFSSTAPAISGQIPLWMVRTDATSVTLYTDLRAVFSNGGGGGGGGGASTLDDAYEGPSGPGTGSGRIIDANDGPVLVRNTQADAEPELQLERAAADANTLPSMQIVGTGDTGQARMAVYANEIRMGSGTGNQDAVFRRVGAKEVALEHPTLTTSGDGVTLRFGDTSAPATPVGNKDLFYSAVYGLSSRFFAKGPDGVTLGPIGDYGGDLLFQRGQRGGWHAPHTAVVDNGFFGTLGGFTTAANVTGTPTVAIDSTGRYMNFQTGAVSGNDAGFITTNPITRRGTGTGATGYRYPRWLAKIQLPTITSIRVFIGFTNQTLATMVGADNPAGHYWGFQFSTPRGDANWQIVHKDNVTQRLGNTGVAVTTGAIFLASIERGAATIQGKLWDIDFGSETTVTHSPLNIPGSTVDMYFMVGIETETNAARDIKTHYGNLLFQGT